MNGKCYRNSMKPILIYLILASIALWSSLAMPARWIPLNGAQRPDEIQINVKSQSFDNIIVEISIPGVWIDETSTRSGEFVRIQVPESGVAGEIGYPQIPAIRQFVAIPHGAEITWEILDHTQQVLPIPELTRKPLYPRQPPIEKVPGALENTPFAWEQDAYSRNRWLPESTVEIGQRGYLRAYSFVPLTVYPVQVNPQRSEITVLHHVSIRLHIRDADPISTANRIRRYGTLENRMLAQQVMQIPPSLHALDELPTPPLGFLIITDPIYQNDINLQEYAEWKAKKGYQVTLVTTNETGPTRQEIANYIQTAYDEWDVPPVQVLLIGDTGDIPYFTGSGPGNPGTDLYYACVEGGDYFADIGIGRLSVTSPDQLGYILTKILNFERVEWTGNDDWETHASFLASTDNYTVSEGTHNFVIETYLEPAGYTCDRFYTYTHNATTQQVIDAINEGRSLVIYSGHGSETGWADGPPMNQTNVRELTNQVYPFVCSFSCLTGQFQYSECFGETWIRTENAAIAFWGSSVTSFWDEDDILERRMFEGFFDNQFPGDDVNFTWLSGMTNYAKIRLHQHFGPTPFMQRYFEMYNILGDASVDMWTSVPQIATVTHPQALLIGQDNLSVTVLAGEVPAQNAMVCAMNDYAWGSAYTDPSGVALIEFDQPLQTPGELYIYVTGHNLHPAESSLQIITPSGPFVCYSQHQLHDPAGNNNGQLDYNESVTLDLTITNLGVAPATNVNVTLTCRNQHITLTDSTEAFGDVGVEQQVTSQDAFAFTLSPNIADNTDIEFVVRAVANEGEWQSDFTILAHAPHITCISILVDDASGNNNGILDPGESADLEITVTNSGSLVSDTMSAELSTLEALVSVVSGSGGFPILNPEEQATATFSVSASSACPIAYQAGLILTVSEAATGREQVDRFELEIGDATQLPCGPDNYGYYAYDSHEITGAPTYDWIEINSQLGGPGTFANLTGDDQTMYFNLPFSFQYYGTSYDMISICTNGWICMGYTSNTTYEHYGIPNSSGPPAMIAPHWEDLNPQNGGTIWVWADSAGGRYIIEYYEIHQFNPSWQWDTFQIILHDPAVYSTSTGDGEILFQYQTANDYSECTVGIENADETTGIQYLFDETYHPNAVEITPETAILFTTGQATSPGSVTGNVALLGGTGNLQDVEIRVGTATTNPLSNGSYSLSNAPSGLQTLLASLYAYGTVALGNLVIPEGGILSGIDINLPYLEPPSDLVGTCQDNYVHLEWQPSNFADASDATLTQAPTPSRMTSTANTPDNTTRVIPNGGVDQSLEFLGYNIYRDHTIIDSLIQDTEYQDQPPEYGTYLYYITAQYTMGESDSSNHVSVLYQESAVSQGEQTLLPERFALRQNYPNPFNPQTTVPFDLPDAGHVTLQVFNILGQRVATVVNQPLPAGFHKVNWTGSNLSSGVYFYRITVRQHLAVVFEDLKKALIVK